MRNNILPIILIFVAASLFYFTQLKNSDNVEADCVTISESIYCQSCGGFYPFEHGGIWYLNDFSVSTYGQNCAGPLTTYTGSQGGGWAKICGSGPKK